MATRNIAEELRREWQAWEEEKKRQGLHFPQPQHWNPQQEQLSETVTICAGCQHENPEGAKFCTACGVRLNTERAGAMTKNWHVGKILLLWAVDLMIGGMVLWGASRPVRQESLWGSSTKAASFPYA